MDVDFNDCSAGSPEPVHSLQRVAPGPAVHTTYVPWRAAALMAACLFCDQMESASLQFLDPMVAMMPPGAALRCACLAALLPHCLFDLPHVRACWWRCDSCPPLPREICTMQCCGLLAVASSEAVL